MNDGWSLEGRDPSFIKACMPLWEWLYRHYFRVETSGWQYLNPGQQYLFVGSHNGGLAAPDMMMMIYDWFRHFDTKYPVYGLMHPYMWTFYGEVAKLAVKVGAVRAHPKMALAAFDSGASVLVYPGGGDDVFRPHSQRDRIYFAGRRGFIKLALRAGVPIVPAISWGAHDTLYVIHNFYPQVKELLQKFNLPWLFDIDPQVLPIYLGLPWIVALGPLPNIPLPMPIRTHVGAPIIFERYGREAACDRGYVDACYHLVVTEMQRELDNLIKKSESNAINFY